MRPSERTLKYLRGLGYHAASVEKHVHRGYVVRGLLLHRKYERDPDRSFDEAMGQPRQMKLF